MKIKNCNIINNTKTFPPFKLFSIIYNNLPNLNSKTIVVLILFMCILLTILTHNLYPPIKIIIYALFPVVIIIDNFFGTRLDKSFSDISGIFLLLPISLILLEVLIWTVDKIKRKYKFKKFEPGLRTKMAVHNFKNLLFAVYGYIESGHIKKAQQIIFEINDTFDKEKSDNPHNYLNIIVNNLVLAKKIIAEKHNIILDFDIHIEPYIYIKEIDLCNLIGNIIDNSIEACNKTDNPNKKFINIKITSKENYIHILAENPRTEGDNSISKTTKEQNGSHGFGFKSINGIVSKYNGTKVLNLNDNTFSIEIILQSLQDCEIA